MGFHSVGREAKGERGERGEREREREGERRERREEEREEREKRGRVRGERGEIEEEERERKRRERERERASKSESNIICQVKKRDFMMSVSTTQRVFYMHSETEAELNQVSLSFPLPFFSLPPIALPLSPSFLLLSSPPHARSPN
jgi:hypothetical protein